MKTRKERIIEYDDCYQKYLSYRNDDLALIEEYFKDNKLDLQKAIEDGTKRANYILENRKYNSIIFTLFEEPFKTERPRVGRFKNIYSPNAKENHDYFSGNLERLSKRINKVMKLLSKVITTPSEIEITAYFPIPKVKKKNAAEILLFMTGILKVLQDPDYDNIGKAYTDMLNSTIIIDDRIFYKGTITKLYHIIPKVVIKVTYQESHDSITLYEKISSNKSIIEYQDNGLVDLKFLEWSR